LEIELADFEAENAMLKGYYLWQVVEIVIGGISTVLGVRFIFLFMSLHRKLLHGYVSTYVFDPEKH
jgi:hypothetical protein